MSIKIKIRLGFICALILIVILGSISYFTTQQIERQTDQALIATQVVKVATSRRGLLFDYLRFHEERPKAQWQLQVDAITKLTRIKTFDTPEEKTLLSQIQETSEQNKAFFAEIAANYERPKSSQAELALAEEQEQILIDQMLVATQANITRGYILSNINLAHIKEAQRIAVLLVVVSMVFLLFFFIVLLFFFDRVVAKPLIKLKEAAVRIASLDFSSTTTTTTTGGSKDELGDLARAFDKMTAKLKESYAVLEQKVFDRTKDLFDAKANDEAILSSIGDAVMACDKEGRVVLFNGVAEELTGYSAQEAIGQHYSQSLKLIKESDEKPSDDFIAESIKTGKKTAMANHTLIIRKNGSKIPASDSAAPIRDASGVLSGCVVVFRDVTREREIDKSKSEFVSLASHQLKTPPTAIKWITELLLDGKINKLTVEQRRNISDVHFKNEQMIKLVNALLDVSRIELGTFAITPTSADIGLLTQGVVEGLKLQIREKNLRVKERYPSEKLTMPVDTNLLQIVIQNLLTNAIHYTPEKGEITIEVSSKNKGEKFGERILKENSVTFTVADNGCGIPREQQDKIFTKLFRADNAREKYTDGTGLGLYIVKSILDNSGGAIWFASEENKGTTFFITIPLTGTKAKAGDRQLTSASAFN